MTPRPPKRSWGLGMIILSVVILLPPLFGFGLKFFELVSLVHDEDGAFAVMPVLNYLFVSAGFLLLLTWGLCNGMFQNVEQPKRVMLDNERLLDEQTRLEEEREEDWRLGD
jgi:hypothetical protein